MGNSASALPYSIGKTLKENECGWKVSEGSQKSDGAAVTVFTASKLSANAPMLRHHFHQCKRLRHPHLLKVEATLDTDHPDGSTTEKSNEKGDYIIVTEPCVSLEEWLTSGPSPQELAWGLQCMVLSLSFLHGSANLAHGNVSPQSFRVTPAGDVKLWSYGLATTKDDLWGHFKQYDAATPAHYRSPERKAADMNLIQSCGIHVMDAYGLGILMQTELYPGTVPATLQKALQRLIAHNPKMRPRLQGLLKCPLLDTPYAKLQNDLMELTVQSVESKIQFWQQLPIPQITERVAIHKIVPFIQSNIVTICSSDALIHQEMYKRELLSMLHVLFALWERFEDGSSLDWTPTVKLLFGVQDRAVRGMLLQKLSLLEQKIDESQKKTTLNSAVFEPMCSGFSDSSAALRELTLKSSLQLVPHLSPANLEKLSRYLVRLQGDPEPSIRTNTIVLIVKVTPQLGQVQQEKLLMPALSRGLKDQFDPCRLAALNAILQYQQFSPQDVANKVLPTVTPHLLDASGDIRAKAFEVVESCLKTLKEEHQNLLQQQQQVSAAPIGGAAPMTTPMPASSTGAPPSAAPTSGGSGYLSGFSSWMSSTTQPEGLPVGGAAPAATGAMSSMRTTPAAAPSGPQKMAGVTSSFAATSLNDSWGEDGDGGWGDDDLLDTTSPVTTKPTTSAKPFGGGWGDDDDLLGSPVTSKPSTSALGDALLGATSPVTSKPFGAPTQLPVDKEDDFFSSFDTKPAKPAVVHHSPPPRGVGSKKLALPKSKDKTKKTSPPAPVVTKLKMDMDDWDDF